MEKLIGEDQASIDRLPDDLLSCVVSRLPVIEGGKTSVLSRRWRYFWKSSSVLDFDALQLLFESDTVCLREERIKFVRRVNRVLDMHSGTTIEQFRIVFDLDQSNAEDINKWLQFAFAKRVKRLELNFSISYTGYLDKQYNFPNMCDTIERLRITPLGIVSYESLVSLKMVEVNVTEEILEFFVCNCPFLEEIRVWFSRSLKKFTTSSPLARLKCLDIATCAACKSIEICAPNLLSFAFYGIVKISIVLKNVSPLISLTIAATRPSILMDNINQVSGCLSMLETLKLHTSIYGGYVLRKVPDFPRLKKLVLDIRTQGYGSLLCFTSIMNVAPLLRELVIKLNWSETLIQRTIPPPLKERKGHDNLEVLQIQGFAGAAIDLGLAQYVIENARSLRKIVVDFRRQEPDVMCKLEIEMARAGDHTQMAMSREGVAVLKSKLPDGVELIIQYRNNFVSSKNRRNLTCDLHFYNQYRYRYRIPKYMKHSHLYNTPYFQSIFIPNAYIIYITFLPLCSIARTAKSLCTFIFLSPLKLRTPLLNTPPFLDHIPFVFP